MKILYIVPRFYPFKGGAESNIEALAVRAAADGNDVTVFTTNVKFRNENLPWTEEYKEIKIIRHWALNSWLYLGFYPKLFINVLKSDAEVIHVSGFGFMWIEFCLITKRIFDRKIKIINTPHGPFMAFSNTGIRGVIKKLYTLILKVTLPFLYHKVIAVVESQKEWITSEYSIPNNRIVTIPNGINESYIEKNLPVYNKDEKVIVTYLNRMEWYKGIHTVLYAMNKLDKAVLKKMEFWIMGKSGNYTQKLKEIIDKKNLNEFVKFIYTPTDEQRDEAFLKSQINILPSKWEATGIALIEAMAKGNVIITTYENQAWDMLINEKSGYVFNFGDEDELAKIFTEIVSNYEKRQEIIKNNVDFAKSFTWEQIYPLYKQLLNSLKNEG